jgi:hypothetical protein
MRIIDEIYRQRTILGLKQANRVILSHSAFQQLLAHRPGSLRTVRSLADTSGPSAASRSVLRFSSSRLRR